MIQSYSGRRPKVESIVESASRYRYTLHHATCRNPLFANDSMPSHSIQPIKLSLQVLCEILFHAELAQSFKSQFDRSVLHCLVHVNALDDRLVGNRCTAGSSGSQQGLWGIACILHFGFGSEWRIEGGSLQETWQETHLVAQDTTVTTGGCGDVVNVVDGGGACTQTLASSQSKQQLRTATSG